LGIAERSEDEQPLLTRFIRRRIARQLGVSPDIVVQFGEPVLQIDSNSTANTISSLSARAGPAGGHYWRSRELTSHQGHSASGLMAIGDAGIEAVVFAQAEKNSSSKPSNSLASRRGRRRIRTLLHVNG